MDKIDTKQITGNLSNKELAEQVREILPIYWHFNIDRQLLKDLIGENKLKWFVNWELKNNMNIRENEKFEWFHPIDSRRFGKIIIKEAIKAYQRMAE